MLKPLSLFSLIVVATLTFGSADARDTSQVIQGDASASYTNWLIEHDKEDGTGDDICIMTAFWPWMKGNVGIRKDASEPGYKLRVLDPNVQLFKFGEQRPIAVLTTKPTGGAMIWRSQAWGIGTIYDMHFPTGVDFDNFTNQLFDSGDVSFNVSPKATSHVFTARLGNGHKAWAVFQDCLASLAAKDERW